MPAGTGPPEILLSFFRPILRSVYLLLQGPDNVELLQVPRQWSEANLI